jgi:hypothetical protein
MKPGRVAAWARLRRQGASDGRGVFACLDDDIIVGFTLACR